MIYIYIGIKKNAIKKVNYKEFTFSVVVPARNEEGSIGRLIESVMEQNYPTKKIQLIIVNDRSDDQTESIIHSFQSIYPSITYIKHSFVPDGISPKKYALSEAIKKASGEIIVFTDADCIVKKTWIEELNTYYLSDTDVVCAPVSFVESSTPSFFKNLITLDFLSLISTSAGAIGMNSPVICNGANFSFRKSAYIAVNGYEGGFHQMAGEDDFLLYKFKNENYRISYAWASNALVETEATDSFKQFLEQRKRWGSMEVKETNSEWNYKLYGIYFFYLLLLYLIVMSVFNSFYFLLFISIMAVKLCVELPIISEAIALVKRPRLWLYVPFVQLFQIPYVTIVGAWANLSNYQWKK